MITKQLKKYILTFSSLIHKRGVKKIIKISVATICVIVNTILLASLYTNIILGVSLPAKIAELYLWTTDSKETFATTDDLNLYFEQQAKLNAEPIKVPKTKSTITKISVTGFPVFFLDEDSNAKKIVLYLHGGAYVKQPNSNHWSFVDRLAQEADIPVVFPIYPLAPDYQFEDGYTFIQEVYDILIKRGYTDIIFMGDSAGGGFALGFAEWLNKQTIQQPEKLILLSPWLDLTLENPEISKYDPLDPMLSPSGLIEKGKSWAGNADRKDYRLSPIFGDLQGLPPIVMFVGTHEIILADAQKLKNMADNANIDITYYEYEGMNHVFPLFSIPEADKAFDQIKYQLF
nr:alpha/beta hydrolase [uncultured Blautia sp.]